MPDTIQILDPSAEDIPEEKGLNANLPSLRGKTIGLLENRKYHADSFLHELKEVLVNDSRHGAGKGDTVKGDMVFFEGPKGGAVFSTGSIAWCGSLSWNDYDNNVSRITENVLRRFDSSEPF